MAVSYTHLESKEMGQDMLHVNLDATPATPITESAVKQIGSGAFVGLAAGIAIIFLLGALDGRVMSVEDLTQRFDEPMLGVIPVSYTHLYYKRATVLLAFYKGNGSRGHVDVIGEVVKQGSVDVPADNVLTLFQAISSAGGFKDSADKEHVQIIHHDPDPSKAVSYTHL